MIYSHKIELEVRDYECDMQGIVNNAVYQHYLEHARHRFLNTKQVNFTAATTSGIHLVIVRAELDYRDSLQSNDKFEVRSRLNRLSKVRFEFQQDIYRLPDNRLMLEGRIIGTALNEKGRPCVPTWLEQLFC